MKTRITILLIVLIGMLSMVSCRGKAGIKAIESAQKFLKKTPKKSTTIKGGALLESGKYADDAARMINEIDIDEEEEYVDESEYDW